MRIQGGRLIALLFLQATLLVGAAVAAPVTGTEIAIQLEVAEPGDETALAAVAGLATADDRFGLHPATAEGTRRLGSPEPAPSEDQNVFHSGDASPGASGQAGETDPLKNVLRSLVNVNRHRDPAAVAGGARPAAEPLFELGEESRALVNEARESLADIVRTAIDPQVDDAGRVSFSLAGVDGIHLDADGSTLAIGVGDTRLGSVSYGAGGARGEIGNGYAAGSHGGSLPADPAAARRGVQTQEPNLVREAVDFIVAFVEHPLTWLLIVLLIVGRIAVAILTARVEAPRRAPQRQSDVRRRRSRERRVDAAPAGLEADSARP